MLYLIIREGEDPTTARPLLALTDQRAIALVAELLMGQLAEKALPAPALRLVERGERPAQAVAHDG
jgi:hypothetical protein